MFANVSKSQLSLSNGTQRGLGKQYLIESDGMKWLRWIEGLDDHNFLNDTKIGNMAQIMMRKIYGSKSLVQYNQDILSTHNCIQD